MASMSSPTSMPMQTPQDLFVHELSDMLSSEAIVETMLGEAQSLAQDPMLKQGLQRHLEETRQHVQNVRSVFRMRGAEPHPVICRPAEGLHRQLHEAMSAQPSQAVLDGLIAASGAKTEHLEIAAYTGLIEKARLLGLTEAADLLGQNLEQEREMLKTAERIGTRLGQQMAGMSASRQSMQQGMQG